ncbi:MAG: acetyltransferase [Alphaproteobacteria bacterium]|nr:acetyltransferase [Alphaproteobacteria bacterium]
MKKIIIFGSGQIAEVAHFYFTHDSDLEVVGFTLDSSYLQTSRFLGLPCMPFETVQDDFPPNEYGLFIALSYAQLNTLRTQKYMEAKAKGYKLVNYISSKATIWPKLEGQENCFILEDNTIQPFVTIGNNVTLWSGNHIGHHATIGDNCFISSHVVISGDVKVGRNCFIGVNSTIRNGISIGDYNVIGASSLIMGDTEDNSVYIASPTPVSKVPSQRLKKI